MKKTIVAIIFIFIITFSLNVFAKEKVDLNIDKSSVESGDEITVSINFSKEEQAAYAYTAKLSYDEDVFETIERENFEEQENWSDINYNTKTNKFALINKSGESGKKLVQVKLKVRDEAKQGKTTISVGNVTSTDGENDISIDGNSVEVQVGDVTTNSTPDEIKNTSNEKISAKAEKQPVKYLAIIPIVMIILLAAFLVYINKNNKVNKNKKTAIYIISGIASLAMVILTISILKTEKTDVNNDDITDYEDADKIVNYLLEIENPDEKVESQNADTNNAQLDTNLDGEISTADVGRVLRNIKYNTNNNNSNGNGNNNLQSSGGNGSSSSQNWGDSQSGGQAQNSGQSLEMKPTTTPTTLPSITPTAAPTVTPSVIPSTGETYTTSIKESAGSEFKHTPKKGEELYIDLDIEVTPYQEIKEVVINGEQYLVKKRGKNSYRIVFPAPNVAGLKNLIVTGVVLEDGNILNANYEIRLDVLKEIPQVDEFTVNNDNEKTELSFTIKDTDGAYTGGKVTVKDNKGNVIFEKELSKIDKNNKISLPNIVKDQEYTVTVDVNYDLDSNFYGDIPTNSSTTTFEQKIKVNADYGFIGTNWNLPKQVREQDKLLLTFENTYNSYYDVEKVVVSGKTYTVEKVGNIYQVELDKGIKGAQNTITVQKVILANGKEITVNNVKLSYEYIKEPIKQAPKAEIDVNIVREPTQEGIRNIKATLQITDVDKTIKNIKAVLRDPSGDVVREKLLEGNETAIEFILGNILQAGNYTIEIVATYDIGDDLRHEDEVIGSKIVPSLIYSSIEKAETKYYVEKNEQFQITYTIKSNTDEDPNAIIIDGNTYKLTKVSKGVYTATITAPDTAGVVEYNAQILVYANDQIGSTNTTKIEVLKNIKPQISALSFDAKSEGTNPKLSFKISDQEDTFVSGKVRLIADGEKPIEELEFTSIDNTTFELTQIEQFKKYKVEIEITYDFDSDKQDTNNKKTEVLSPGEIEWIDDYDFELEDYKLDHIDTQSKKIYVTFNSTNSSQKYKIKTVEINGVDYEVTANGDNSYTVEISYEDSTRQELELQKVILDNLQGFEAGRDFNNINKIVVFKDKPTAEVSAGVENDNKQIKVKAVVKDGEIKAENIQVRLTDENGTIVGTKPLENSEAIFTLENDEVYVAGTYKVEILADFDAADGEETIGRVIASTETIVEIQASATGNAEKEYAEKKSEVKINYEITANTTKELKKVVIDGEEVDVTHIKGNEYQATLIAPDSYGYKEYKLTGLIYDGEETVSVDETSVTVDVLRNVIPQINDVGVGKNNEDKTILTFSVNDPESTFVSGKIKVQQTNQEIDFEDLNNLSFELNGIEKSQQYDIEISLTYDLDSKKNDSEHQNSIEVNKQFRLLSSYDLDLKNYKVVSFDKANHKVKLQFTANLTVEDSNEYYINAVRINGTMYEDSDLQRDGDTYTMEIPYDESEERQELKLEEVIINSLHKIQLEDKKVVIFKKVIAAIIPKFESNKISVTLDITDKDEITKNLRLVLCDSQGNELQTQKIETTTHDVVFDIDSNISGDYTVKLLADFDAEDGNGLQNNVVVTSDTVKVPVSATITAVDAPRYVNKNSGFEATFTISTNSKSPIKALVIDGETCEVTKTEDGKYTVTIIAPQDHGKREMNVTNINFEDGESIEASYTLNIEVIKSEKPTVSNIKVDDSEENAVLSYDIKDQEDTFIGGKIIITNTKDNSTQEIEIEKGENPYAHILKNIKSFTKYNLTFELKYDLDEDKDDAANQGINKITGENFELIEDYNFQLSNLQVENVDRTAKKITLSFYSSNASEDNDEHEDYYVKEVTINGAIYSAEKTNEKNGNMTKYTVTVPYDNEERTELKLEQAKLNNLKEFNDLKEQVIVFKTVPIAEVSAEITDQEQKQIKATINIKDNDETITTPEGLTAKLLNPSGEALSTKTIDKTTKEVEFASPNADVFKAGEYTVQILANYERYDGETHTNEEIGSDKVIVNTKVTLTSAELVSDYYVEKNSKVKVKYEFTSNNGSTPSGITVGSVYCTLEKQDDGSYIAEVPAGATCGEQSINVTSVIYEGHTGIIENSTEDVKYYVLKDTPSIEKFDFDEYAEEPSLTIGFKNPDGAIINGAKVIIKKQGEEDTKKEATLNTTIQEELDIAETTIDLSDLATGIYEVTLEGTYDRDDIGDVTQNIHQLSEILSKKTINIIAERDASIEIQDVKVENKDVTITFTSTNSLNLDVRKITVEGNQIEDDSKEIAVTKLNEPENTYTAVIKLKERENQQITITSITLDYSKDITIALKEDNLFEIYKQKPEVTDISYEAKNDGLYVTYTLTDEADIAKNIKAIATKQGTEESTIVNIENKAQKEVIFPDIKNVGNYDVQFVADFDCVDGEEYVQEPIGEIKNCNIGLKAQIKYVNEDENKFKEKGEKVTLKYEITANTIEKPTAISIEGEDEESTLVEEAGNTYKATLTAPQEKGEKTYKVKAIKFGNTTVTLDENQANNSVASIYVLKNKPEVKDYNLDTNKKQITFELNDGNNGNDKENDDLNGTVSIYSGNESKKEQKLEWGTNTIDLSGSEFNEETVYELKLSGTYNRGGSEQDKQNLYDLSQIFKQNFQLKITASLAFDSIDTHYPEKGKPVTITFKATDNTEMPITGIFIGEQEYPATSIGDDKYQITYVSPKEAGVKELEVNKVKYEDDEITIEKISNKIEVLRSKPYVPFTKGNFEIDDNYDDRSITFKFKLMDDENTILKDTKNQIKAYIRYADYQDDQGRKEVPITEIGTQQEVTFKNIETDGRVRMVEIYASYDLDTDALNSELGDKDENEKENDLLIRIGAALLEPSSLEITNIQSISTNTNEPSRYLGKNEEFKVSFNAKTYTGSIEGGKENSYYPEYATINGQNYELERSEDKKTYTTKEALSGYGTAGLQEIKIENVTLNNLEVINEKYIKGTVDVLKDQLTVENFKVDTTSGKAVTTFDLNDPDGSFVKGVIQATENAEDGTEHIVTMDVNKELEAQRYELKLDENKKYKVELKIDQDLDSEQVENSDHYTQTIMGTANDVEIITDYDVKVSDLTVLNIDKTLSNAKLQFKATTSAINHKISTVKIENMEVETSATYDEATDSYTFYYPIAQDIMNEKKRTSIKLIGVTMDNEIKPDLDEPIETTIFRTKPEVNDVQIEVTDNQHIKVTYNVTDEDSTLKNLKIELQRKDGTVATDYIVNNYLNERDHTFDITEPGKYNIVIKGEFDLADGETHTDEELAKTTEEIKITPDSKIIEGIPSNTYPNKGDTIDITYTIPSNISKAPTKLLMDNNQEYNLEPAGEPGKYKIMGYKVNETAGIQSIEVDKICYDDNLDVTLNPPHITTIDVLKDEPTFEISSVDYLERDMVMFNIHVTDDDKAMTGGKAETLGHIENLEAKGTNTHSFSVTVDQKDIMHNLNVQIDYDLDTDEITESEDRNISSKTAVHQFMLTSDLGLSLNNLRIVDKETDAPLRYANKTQQIRLKFNSTNKTQLKPEKLYIKDISDDSADSTSAVPHEIHQVEGTENEYYIDLVVGKKAGQQKFEIGDVILTGNKTISKNNITIEPNEPLGITVLKDAPTIGEYSAVNNGDNLTVSFNITDSDNTLDSNSKITLTRKDDNKLIESHNIHVGPNNYTFSKLEPGITYTLKIENKHNLSDDGENYKDEVFKTDDITIKQGARFKVRNLKITERVPEGGKVKITFENSEMSEQDVDSIVIDGETYTVTKDLKTGVYSLELEPKEKGQHILQVQVAKIGDKEFPIERPLTYVYKNITPTATPTSDIYEEYDNAKIDYTLTDPDKAVKSLKINMRRSAGTIAQTVEVTDFDIGEENSNTLSIKKLKFNIYSIELVAVWDIGNGTLEEEKLFEKSTNATPEVIINSNTIDKEYVEKAEEVELTYNIYTNIDGEVKKIYIDNNGYSVEKALDKDKKVIPDTYKVKLTAPNGAGVYPQKVTAVQIGSNLINGSDGKTRLQYNDGVEQVPIKVLRDAPTLVRFAIDEEHGKATFRINDADGALSKTQYPHLVVKDESGENDIGSGDVKDGTKKDGYTEYEMKLDALGMTEQKKYKISATATYDLRPDAPEENILQRLLSMFIGNKNEAKTIATDEEDSEESEYIKTTQIFEDVVKLTGVKQYNFSFEDKIKYYPMPLGVETNVEFYCSTGTDDIVKKVIIDGKEYPVSIHVDENDDDERTQYRLKYIPQGGQTKFHYETLILENGYAYDVDEIAVVMLEPVDPTFNLVGFSEDTQEGTVTFTYNIVDPAKELASNLTFILQDSSNAEIGRQEISPEQKNVTFDIPDPPTSTYRLIVTAKVYGMPGWSDYTIDWTGYDQTHQSSITTSILGATYNKYPTKGETFGIIYNISSTEVVRIDAEDHSNIDSAVSISKMVINNKEYDVETLDSEDLDENQQKYGNDKYRIYYTAQDNDGVEDIVVSKVIYSNGKEVDFERTDKIDVLKDKPQVTNFTTENELGQNKVKFKFRLDDPDNVISTDDDIYALVDGKKFSVRLDEDNEIEADIEHADEILDFEIKGKYDLDSDKLEVQGDDNNYTDETIFKKQFIYTGKYDIKFDDMKLYNSKGEETNYFEKGEDLKLTYKCSTRWSDIYPEKVNINGTDYTAEKAEDIYTVKLKAEDTAGLHTFTFNKVLLNSGNEVELTDETGKFKEYEVLKDPVTVEDFTYTIDDHNNKVNLRVKIKDDDQANDSLTMKILDENSEEITPNNFDGLKIGDNSIEFDRTDAGKYFVEINSTYHRDKEKTVDNTKANERIHYEIITVNSRYIEMKDIMDIELYTHGIGNVAQKIDTITQEALSNPENCMVKVIMKDMTQFYSNVLSCQASEDGSHLILLLQYTDAMAFNGGTELKPLEVTLDEVPGEHKEKEYQYSESFKMLVEKMKAAQQGEEIQLTHDYDLSNYSDNNDSNIKTIVNSEFKGTLKGNGHRIYNLKKSLFSTLKGATIENLVIEEPELLSKGTIFTNTAESTTIRGVRIVRPTFNPGDGSSVIATKVSNNSLVENCSVSDIIGSIGGYGQSDSGFIFEVLSSKVKNCYITGAINGGWHINGGFIGKSDSKSEISNNIIDLAFTPSWPEDTGKNGCVIYDPNGAVLKNNISLLKAGNARTIYYPNNKAPGSDSENNYQLEESTAKKNEDGVGGVRTIKKENVNREFFISTLGFSEDIWNIPEDTSADKLPTLKNESISYTDEGSKPKNPEVYIPDFNRVSKLKEYKEDKEITYHNMYKLMPFYDAKELIYDGNKIPDDNDLSKKLIKNILAFNKEGKMVSYLTTEDYNSIDSIRVMFEDGTKARYHVDFDDYYGNVASYMISEFKIGYNYNNYVIDLNADIIKEIEEAVSQIKYADINALTVTDESRLYREHFEKETQHNIEDFVVKTLINMGYTPNTESDLMDAKIRQELTGANIQKLKRLLYAYNYFTYWYGHNMEGMDLSDIVMFHGKELFSPRMTLENLTDKLLLSDSNVNTNATGNFYNNYIRTYTKLDNLGYFLDYLIKGFTSYTDNDDWFKDEFHGGIYKTVTIDCKDVYYSMVDHAKIDGKVQNSILVALTVPENSMFLISAPTQVFFGSLYCYWPDPTTPEAQANLHARIEKFADQVKYFYEFAYNIWGIGNMNSYCDCTYDYRKTYTGRGTETVYNNKYSTEDRYHKYFAEAVDRWPGTAGLAYATGDVVMWANGTMLNEFRVSSHETLHNQDSKIFMKGYGRRGDGEDYAAGFIQQYYRDGWVSPNVLDEEPLIKENVSQNLHRSTVDTDDKIKNFYKNYFDVNDFLDYIAGTAFLSLSNQQKASLPSVKVSYPKEKEQGAGDVVVGYTPLTENDFSTMNLESVDDLWTNQIMLKPGCSTYREQMNGADTDSIFNLHWYQPHADNGRPDAANFKYLAWQMAGERGYIDGMVAYYSAYYISEKENGNRNTTTTDLTALRYITGDEEMTYQKYKKNRYDRLKKYVNEKGLYVDGKEFYDEYLAALKQDADAGDKKATRSTEVKRKYFRQIRSDTNDFTIDPFTQTTDTDNNAE